MQLLFAAKKVKLLIPNKADKQIATEITSPAIMLKTIRQRYCDNFFINHSFPTYETIFPATHSLWCHANRGSGAKQKC